MTSRVNLLVVVNYHALDRSLQQTIALARFLLWRMMVYVGLLEIMDCKGLFFELQSKAA